LATTSSQSRTPKKRQIRRRAKKSLGQHFLVDEQVVHDIAVGLDLRSDDTVIEIGAGQGILTRELTSKACRVVAVELDDVLAERLREEFDGTNVEVVHGDALEMSPATLLGDDDAYVLAGNLPYNIAQPLLRQYLETHPQPRYMVVMLQSEVADSIVAEPGRMSLLSVAVQLYGKPQLLFRVPPTAFRPPPKVNSAVVRIDVAKELRVRVDDTEAFFDLVRAGFSTRRKQLRNSLANGLSVTPNEADQWLAEAGIDPTLRPQALSLEDWSSLDQAWASAGRPGRQR
jgi:16S rRNA (adenine1518-N6/adenine1519-N6)-dimethyltransferase